MDDKPPFDAVRASFYLVAAILGVQMIVVMTTLCWCMLNFDQIIAASRQCDASGKLSEILTGALASALAFAGGFTRRDK